MKGITDMKLENYEVHLPSYSIGSTIYNKIGPVCESYGRTVLVIGGEKALAAAYEKIAAAVAETRLAIMGTLLLSRGVSLCHELISQRDTPRDKRSVPNLRDSFQKKHSLNRRCL